MADIIPGNFAEVTVPFRHATLPRSAAVVFGVSAANVSDASVVAAGAQAAVIQAFAPLVDNQVTIGPALARRAPADGSEPVVGTATGTGSGGRSGDSLPANCAPLLRKFTARGGRRGRGRMYVPWGLAESEVDEAGALTPAAVTKLNTAGEQLLLGLANADTPMVILHSVGATSPGSPNLVVNLVGDPRLATQRRRLGR